MPGIIIHVIAATICLVIVHLLHFKWEYSLSIFVGQFVPDAIKIGFTAIKQGTLSILNIKKDAFYYFLREHSSSYTDWFALGFFIFGLMLLLYHFHVIKKKKMEEYDELYVFFLIGIILHLILDALIFEKGIWI